MRDLHKILKLFETESPMEYCEEFAAVKSVLEYCHKHVKPFNKLHFRSGNEPFINDLSQRLQQLLVERELVAADSKEPLPKAYPVLRKLLMFLLVNTDATYKYNLREDPLFAHVLESCPLLPKFLLVALVWELHLDRFFYEALSYTPCWFAFQYFEVASDSLKYIDDPYPVLEKVEQLVRAIYTSITRSELRQMDVVDKKIIYTKLYDFTMNLLRQFYTPDADKFKKFTKNQFFRYSGFALKHILQMVLYAFDVYEVPSLTNPDIDISLYELCLAVSKPVATEVRQETSQLKEQQLKLITALLNSLQYNVMLVKIDVFMYWVEVDLDPTQNLQMVVGEMAYKVGERMQANAAFAHDVEAQLKLIAIRPKTLEETIRDATLGEILRSLDEDLPHEVKKAWFDELFQRTVALGNDECLQSIKEHIKLISVENCQQILDFVKLEIERSAADVDDQQEEAATSTAMDQIEVDSADFEQLTSLILLGLGNFSNKQILQLHSYQVKLFGTACKICCQGVDFDERANEFLNKYAASASFELQQLLILCFENPTQMWAKFFDCACHNSDYIANFCATVHQTRPFSNVYFQTLLSGAMLDHLKLQQKFFPHLLCEIYFVLYFPDNKTDFLKQFVNEHVNGLLEAQQYESLLSIVKALNLITTHGETQTYKPLNFGEATAPVLVMAAQIMDSCRWDLVSYTDVRDEIVCDCIQFIQHNSKKFLPTATEKDRKWISKVVKDSYRPLTQYYFQKFALTPDQPALDFDRFLIRSEVAEKSEAEMFLIINYVRCTMKETEWLARSERLQPHISDMLLLLGDAVRETETPHAINNYRHCLANYANIVTKFLLPKVEQDTKEVEKLSMKVLKIVASAPTQIYEEMFMSFECLLLEIVKKSAHPLNPEFVNTLCDYVVDMQTCRAKEIFLEKLRALTQAAEKMEKEKEQLGTSN